MRKTTFKQAVHGDNEEVATTAENAYRRGVHQALVALGPVGKVVVGHSLLRWSPT